jgi:peptidoglycan hydrolase-like protein with peptidoglycan-binding domain
MKKYIFTESQIKKIIDNQLTEQYGDTDTPEDMHYVQLALNKYLQSKNIRGVWDGTYDFKLNPKAPIIVINADGAWGDKSKAALAIFQKNNGLEVDGIVGCKSTKKLIQQGYLGRDLCGKLMDFFGWGPNCD